MYKDIITRYKNTSIRPIFFTLVFKKNSQRTFLDLQSTVASLLRMTKPKLISEGEKWQRNSIKPILTNLDKQFARQKRVITEFEKHEKLFLQKLEKDKALIFKQAKKIDQAVESVEDGKTAVAHNDRKLERIIDEKFEILTEQLRDEMQRLNRYNFDRWTQKKQRDLQYEQMRRGG